MHTLDSRNLSRTLNNWTHLKNTQQLESSQELSRINTQDLSTNWILLKNSRIVTLNNMPSYINCSFGEKQEQFAAPGKCVLLQEILCDLIEKGHTELLTVSRAFVGGKEVGLTQFIPIPKCIDIGE